MSNSGKHARDGNDTKRRSSSREKKKKETTSRKKTAPVAAAEIPAAPAVDHAGIPEPVAAVNSAGETTGPGLPEPNRSTAENDSAGDSGANAAPGALADEDDIDALQMVCFVIEGEEFGIPIHRVQEINRVVKATEIPGSPPHVKGIIDLRGQVIPIIDLRARLGYPERPADRLSRIVVLEDGRQVAGLIVDAVTQVLRVGSEQLTPVPESVSGPDRRCLSGIIRIDDKMVMILDCDQVLCVEAEPVEAGV